MNEGAERVPVPSSAGCYASFHATVAHRQLADWLAGRRAQDVVLDLTPGSPSAELHPRVVGLHGQPRERTNGGLAQVLGDEELLDCLRPSSVDAIVAESGALAGCAITEETLRQAFRVIRPGGRLLLCVESLRRGLADLAAAGRWAELADAPHADVVLIPTIDGGVRRCLTVDELQGSMLDAGFAIEWIRPRTVLPPEAVERAMTADPLALGTLVETELRLAADWTGELAGSWLVASAIRARQTGG